jgi:DNA topoisomerase-1
VQHGKTYANLDAGDDVLNIGLNRAVTLIADKTAQGPQEPPAATRLAWRASRQRRPVVGGRPLRPYVSHDGVNATLPSDLTRRR